VHGGGEGETDLVEDRLLLVLLALVGLRHLIQLYQLLEVWEPVWAVGQVCALHTGVQDFSGLCH
jgi:hypothetical protein